MEQQNNIYPKQKKKAGSRFWNIWGPLIIKFGISYLVSLAFTTVLMATYFMSQGTISAEEIQTVMSSESAFMDMYEVIMEQAVEYLVYVDGIAAILTIPILLIMFYRDKAKEKTLGVVQNKKAELWKYGGAIVMSLTMCLGLNNLILLAGFGSQDEVYQETMELLYSAPFGVQIVCLAILAPICEELVFRGLMFRRLRVQTSFMQAALYSSIVFAFIHGNMVQMIYAFIMGMMFAYLYEKYGSFKAPVIAHIAANLLSVFCTEYNSFNWIFQDTMRVGLITIACAAIASTMYVFITRIEEKPENMGMNNDPTAV
ncbi:MAG: lysostaphin resistance A-like protein [Dorea sp.]